MAVHWALFNRTLARGPCAKCGNQEVQGHHEDYAEPLVVVWLCRSCHKLRHSAMRKEAATTAELAARLGVSWRRVIAAAVKVRTFAARTATGYVWWPRSIEKIRTALQVNPTSVKVAAKEVANV
jgi:hypothetical protein